MKELSIEEKAKRYDEAIEKAIKHRNNDGLTLEQYETIDIIFPELKDSKDEEIRKAIIEHFEWSTKRILNEFSNKKVIALLEKQRPSGCPEYCVMSNCANCPYRPVLIKNPADKVEPKFKIGDKIKYLSNVCDVLAVKEHYYELSYGIVCEFKNQDKWQLVEQKPTWTEEDENRFKNLIYLVEHSDEGKATKEGFIKFINRLKYFKKNYDYGRN